MPAPTWKHLWVGANDSRHVGFSQPTIGAASMHASVSIT